METRRIRRDERRRTRRNALVGASVAVIGIAVGTALPRSPAASVALLGAAACCLAVLAISNPAVAPLHGLHRVVRLPLRVSVAVSLESLASRCIGTAHAIVGRRAGPTPIVLDEPDDDAEEWWGATAEPATREPANREPTTREPATTEPPVLAPWPPVPPPAPPLPAPVLAAPMASARVPSADARSVRAWIGQLGMHLQRRVGPLTEHDRGAADHAGAST